MIEFRCEFCKTYISIAPDQMDGEIFCPACDQQIELPELTPELAAKVAIVKAQLKNIPDEPLDPAKTKEMLDEPDSRETRIWKERLAESFKSVSFKEYHPPEEPPEEQEEGGLKKILKIFKK